MTFWPGWLSPDSVYQLEQARGVFPVTDMHPPVMAAVWRLLDRIVPGPTGMLLVQNGLFWGGLALAAWVWIDSWVAPVLVLVIGLSPPSLSHLGTIVKDVQMGAGFLAAFGLLSLASTRGDRWPLAASLVPLLYGCTMRHNGFVTAAPLLCWWAWLWWAPAQPRWSRAAPLAAGLLVGVAAFAQLADRALTGGKTAHNEQTSFVHDLVAFSIAADRDLLPAALRDGPQDVPLARMKELYLPECDVPLYYPPTPGPHFDVFATTPAQLHAIEATWLRLVLERPGVYLRHRWELFRHLVGLGVPVVCYPYVPDDAMRSPRAAALGVPFTPGPWTRAVTSAFWALRNGPFFRPWYYLVALLAVLGLAWRQRRLHAAGLALGASALLNLAPYFVFAPDCGFRYSWWTAIAALLLPAVIWGRWRALPKVSG
ncbi:MAG TPA: hypothetical protein VMB50_13495 [Myxococcales bacterium]|nr:hypothetical protein [Myxococcales bacterium]